MLVMQLMTSATCVLTRIVPSATNMDSVLPENAQQLHLRQRVMSVSARLATGEKIKNITVELVTENVERVQSQQRLKMQVSIQRLITILYVHYVRPVLLGMLHLELDQLCIAQRNAQLGILKERISHTVLLRPPM
jgi:hypothetical protein